MDSRRRGGIGGTEKGRRVRGFPAAGPEVTPGKQRK